VNDGILSRFDKSLDMESIRQRVTVRPNAVADIASMDPLVAADVLYRALKEIFIPNDFSLAFIKEMLNKASLHNQWSFSSEVDYISRFYNPPDVEVEPICLTGLAGIGKSQTIAALRKVMPSPIDFSCDHFQGTLKLSSYWYASAKGKASGAQLLADFIEVPRATGSKLLIECRRRANRDGVSVLLLEEAQHKNTGKGTARVTDILLTMASIGPPMVYVSNYSLLHLLKRRNSEDLQRLMTEPRIMLPDDSSSEIWRSYIAECIRVSNGCIKGAVDDLAHEIYRSTFGIKRLVVQLLKHAYVIARGAGRDCLLLADIGKAYQCAGYASNREDVEELCIITLGGRSSSSRRMDLRCPFELPTAPTSKVVAFARTDRDTRVINKAFDSSLTEGERAALKELQPASVEPSRPKAARRAPLPPSSIEDLSREFLADFSVPPPSNPTKPK